MHGEGKETVKPMEMNAMKILLISALASLIATGCAHHHVSTYDYHPYRGGLGYVEGKVNEHTMYARYIGDKHTQRDKAMDYANFRAEEICIGQGFEFAHIYEIDDNTETQEVQHSSGGAFATKSGLAVGRGESWVEKVKYPTFTAVFACSKEAHALMTVTRSLKPEDVAEFVKDRLGAVQIMDLRDDSPNKGMLHRGDIIVKVNDERVQYVFQVGEILNSSNRDSATLDIVRDGHRINVTAKVVNANERAMSDALETIGRMCDKFQDCIDEVRAKGNRQPAQQ